MITHKRGDSFDHLAAIPSTFPDGYFVGWTVTAQVRTAQYGKLLAELVCSWADPVTTRTLSVSAVDTQLWDIGNAEMDIQFVRNSDNKTISTNTVSILVLKDVTRRTA